MDTKKTRNVLIVDDTPRNIQVVANILQESGYQMAFARNGKTALHHVETMDFDLILLDIMMPEMDGFEVCRRLKADPKTCPIPVIFLTARTAPEDIVKGFELGGVDYITKPFQKEELLSRVRTHVALRQSQLRLEERTKQLEREIIQRKAIEDRLAQERHLLQTVIDNIPDFIYVKDREGHFQLCNKAALHSLRRTPEDVILGKTDFDLFPEELASRYYADEQAILESGRPLIDREESYLEPNTRAEKWMLTAKIPLYDTQGSITGLVGINHDITERKNAEELMAQAKENLEKLNADKDKFFSIIAHDLRGPLGALHGLTELLVENLEGFSKDKLISLLTTQRDASKNLLSLLENLLTWSRIQRGMIEFFPQAIALGDLISENIILFEAQARQKQIRLQKSLPSNMLAYADFSMVNTVIRNLISNALKFTHPDGSITASVWQDDNRIKVSISDSGMGIEPQYLPQLFQIDTRYQRKGTANEKGTGLGLILCKEFVEQNCGEIWAESELGEGTTFTFTLPLPRDAPEALRQTGNDTDPPGGATPASPEND